MLFHPFLHAILKKKDQIAKYCEALNISRHGLRDFVYSCVQNNSSVFRKVDIEYILSALCFNDGISL